MDPTEALRRARDLTANADLPDDDPAVEALQAWDDLHEWLAKGGFLPEPWAHGNDTRTVNAIHARLEAYHSDTSSAITALADIANLLRATGRVV